MFVEDGVMGNNIHFPDNFEKDIQKDFSIFGSDYLPR